MAAASLTETGELQRFDSWTDAPPSCHRLTKGENVNECEAVRWCAENLDEEALKDLLGTKMTTGTGAVLNQVTAKFDGDLQGLLAALRRASLVELVEAWAAETPRVAKVVGLPRATVSELMATLTELLIAEWRIPLEQPSATPVAGGHLTVVKGPYAAIPKRRFRATWFTKRWETWARERELASQLLSHEYPDLFLFGDLLLLRAEQDYYAVRDLEHRLAELKDAPGPDPLDELRTAASERARAACEAMRADLNAGWLRPRVGPAIDRLVGGLDTIESTDEDLLRQRLHAAREAMTRQARMLVEVGPGIESVVTLMGAQQERDFLERLSARSGNAVVPLIRLIRHQHRGLRLANVKEELTAARTHAQHLLAEVKRDTPYCYSSVELTVDTITQAIRSDDVMRLATVVGAKNTRLSNKEAWTRPTTVVAAAARVLQLLGVDVPIDPLYRAISANPQVRSEMRTSGALSIPPTPATDER